MNGKEWSAEDVRREAEDDSTPSLMNTLEPALADSKEWVAYEGDRGGEGWRNTETGEIVYQDEKPGGGESNEDSDDRDLAELADEEGLLDADDLEAGDEVLIHDDKVTLDGVASDETGAVVQFEKNGEDYFLYEDMIDIEAPGFESDTSGDGSPDDGGELDAPTDSDGPQFEPGDEIESPEGEPATVVDYDSETEVVLYETEGMDEPMMATAESIVGEDPDTDDAEDELAEELGVQWANTDGLDDGQVETITTAFESYREEQGLEENDIMEVTTTPPDDVGMGTGASFTPNQRMLYVNPDGLDPETKREDYESGYISTESVEGTIHHELTHAQHFREVLRDDDLDWQELRAHEFDDEETELITDEVSWYASTSASELVAEVNAGIQEGHSYPDEIMNLYDRFGGPEVDA